jgi:hypothetical protein
MAHPAVAVLESALRSRKLDRTLTTALPSLDRTDPAAYTPTDVAVLDACLRGGLPRGHLSEIAGPRSSGQMTLLLQLVAAATRRGEIAALVDTCDRLDLPSAVAAGIDLKRLLWIRGHDITEQGASRGQEVNTLIERVVERALKALTLVLQAGGFGVVAIDLADVPARALTQLPFTTWMRVQRIVEGRDTACVLVVPEPLARSAGGLTLQLSGRTRWAGASARSRRLAGMEIRTRVLSPRRRVDGDVRIEAAVPDVIARA